MKNKLIDAFCEIVEDYPRVILFSTISLICMFCASIIEYLGLRIFITDLITVLIVIVSGISLAVDYANYG